MKNKRTIKKYNKSRSRLGGEAIASGGLDVYLNLR